VVIMKAGRIVDEGSPTALIRRFGRATLEDVFLTVARSDDAGADASAGGA
jgi:ABC-2 type transport system ATP-binding protein